MKTKFRVTGLILACLMLLPLLAIGASAEAPAAGTILYTQDFESNPTIVRDPSYNDSGNCTTIKEVDGNKVLSSDVNSGLWRSAQLVPAEAMTGVTAYTLQLDFTSGAPDNGNTYHMIRFGTNENGNPSGDSAGNWLTFTKNNFYMSKGYGTNMGNSSDTSRNLSQTGHLVVEVSTTAPSITVYYNGKQVYTTVGDATKTASVAQRATAVYYVGRADGGSATFDNIVVSAGSYADYKKVHQPATFAGVQDTAKSNKVLSRTSDAAWASARLVPAAALEGVTHYTLTVDMTTTVPDNGNHYHNIRFGANSATTSGNVGNWFSFTKNKFYLRQNYDTAKLAEADVGSNVTGVVTISLEIDTVAHTVKAYKNGTEYIDVTDAAKISDANNGIWYVARNASGDVTFDNIVVAKGAYTAEPLAADIIYEEDFENGTFTLVEDSAYNGTDMTVITQKLPLASTEKYSIRLVGVVNDPDVLTNCTELGFKVTAVTSAENKNFDTKATAIYNKLIGSTATGIVEEYTAASLGGSYVYALSICDIPASAGQVTFTVQSYYTTASGTVLGTTYTIVYNAGVLVSMTA